MVESYSSFGTTMSTTAAPAVGMREIEGRGRAMVALKPLKAGEIVLKDSPILVYSALPLFSTTTATTSIQRNKSYYCSNCFRVLEKAAAATVVSCSPCCSSLFCNPNCRSIALANSHTPWVCHALTRLTNYDFRNFNCNLDLQIQARFLVSAYNLSLVSPSAFRTLLSLQGDSDSSSSGWLHSLISSLCPPPVESCFGFSLELTTLLLAKDKLNAFGLMEPFAHTTEERSVRAYVIYPVASFFNHDCLPNACRFDYLDIADAQGQPPTNRNNTDILVRMIHDVPQGREICISYFPVNLRYSERQRRLRDDYGFTCNCDRCQVEANWSDQEGEEEQEEDLEVEVEVDVDHDNQDDGGETSIMDEDCDQDMAVLEIETAGLLKGEDDFPHAYFFLRYMCDRKNCWGTLAPLPPSDLNATPSSIMECNVCGILKKSDEVM